MPPSIRAARKLHSVFALVLFVAVIAAAIALGHGLAGAQELRGKHLDQWMLGAFVIGLTVALGVVLAYVVWVFPRELRDAPFGGENPEQARARERAIAAVEAREEALREALRATPGLERYAELVGRSTIGSVEDARVREARVAELRADPVKAKYAERVFKGEGITDPMIAYWEDPSTHILCAHFGTVESDVRKADPRAHPSDNRTLEAMLGFNFDALKRRYGLGPPLTFWRREWGPQYHGRGEDNYDGLERIECPEHGCTLIGSEHWTKFPAA